MRVNKLGLCWGREERRGEGRGNHGGKEESILSIQQSRSTDSNQIVLTRSVLVRRTPWVGGGMEGSGGEKAVCKHNERVLQLE